MTDETERPMTEKRKAAVVTKANQLLVMLMRINNIPHERIAEVLQISRAALRDNFKEELEHADTTIITNLVGAMYRKAMQGDVRAQERLLEKLDPSWRQKSEAELRLSVVPVLEIIDNTQGESNEPIKLPAITNGTNGTNGVQ